MCISSIIITFLIISAKAEALGAEGHAAVEDLLQGGRLAADGELVDEARACWYIRHDIISCNV